MYESQSINESHESQSIPIVIPYGSRLSGTHGQLAPNLCSTGHGTSQVPVVSGYNWIRVMKKIKFQHQTVSGENKYKIFAINVVTGRNLSVPSFVMCGCYIDSTSDRVLSNYSSVSPLTLNTCALYCAKKVYAFQTFLYPQYLKYFKYLQEVLQPRQIVMMGNGQAFFTSFLSSQQRQQYIHPDSFSWNLKIIWDSFRGHSCVVPEWVGTAP